MIRPAQLSEPRPRSRFHRACAVIGLVLLGLIAYANSFSGPFVFDDVPTIQENRSIRQLWPLGRVLMPEQAGGVTTSGRPLVNLSFALNYAVSGYRVWTYHAVNCAIHLGAALCLFGLVRRTLQRPRLRDRFGSAADRLGWLVAALWLLHPLQTESVTYLVQRAESLVGLFYVLTLYAFVRGSDQVTGDSGRETTGHRLLPVSCPLTPVSWLGLSVVACALGMATKEVMASAPLVVLLYDRTFVAGSFAAAWRLRRIYYGALAATWVLLALLVLGTANRGGTAGFGTAMSSWDYALTQCRALVNYVSLSLWPNPLVFDYGLATTRHLADVLPQALVVIAALSLTVYGLVRRSAWGFAGAVFFAVLAPSSSFVPVVTQTIAEHRMYLPLAVIIALLVLGGYLVAGVRSLYGWAAVLVALTVATMARNHEYRDEITIWADTVKKLPTNARAHTNLGQALFRAGRDAEAKAHYQRALALQPNYPETHYNLGVALARDGDLAQAIAHYETALRLQPLYPEAHNNLANALVRADRIADALRHYEVALQQDAGFAEAHNNLGNALLAAGRPEEAAPHFERALRLKPDYPEARYNLGNAFALAGKMNEALGEYRAALRLKPAYAEAHVNAGNALLALERPTEAVTEYQQALALNPRLAEAANNLGTVFLHSGRIAEAVTQFERALAARPDFPEARRNLEEGRSRLPR